LFSTLPGNELRFGGDYDVRIVRVERVAGRRTLKLAIKPHDDFRYEHRIWLDTDTAFPLQTQIIDQDGVAVEQVKFADIILGEKILASSVAPSYSTENFKWYSPPQRNFRPVVESNWHSDDLPPGFELISVQEEQMQDGEDSVTHIMYSDGLASVSVFIAANSGKSLSKRSRVGASNTFSTEVGEYRVTAVGEVPAATVQRIAASMSLR
jgi:sigma-E factor negative regulatory protein RseB